MELLIMGQTRDCNEMTAMSWPCVGEAGRTGDWRTMRPVLDPEKCVASRKNKIVCMQCWMFCPDNVITRTAPPEINLEYCKGCGICAEVCPSDAIKMTPEQGKQAEPTVMEEASCDG